MRADVELVAGVTVLKSPVPMQTRVGVATGLVVVGDLIGSGASQEQAIVGETPNLAARLQSIAEPNTVVVAESTRRLVGILFELVDLGATLNAFGGVALATSVGCPFLLVAYFILGGAIRLYFATFCTSSKQITIVDQFS